MSRLIDADALINELNNSHYPGAPYIDAGISIAIGKVCDAPTIEPQPQQTGRWIFDENDYLTKCSECGCHPWFGVIPTVKEATKKLPHCPMCLAKMEGE